MKPTIRSSGMDRALNCHGSLTLGPLVDARDGDEGHEGVYIHHLIASRAIAELGAIPPDGGLPPAEVPAGFKLSPFVAWIPDWALRHVRDAIPPTWSLMVELPLAYEFDRWNLSGHIDIVGISPDATEARGVDWKSGPSAVDPAESNEQVLSYVVLLKRAWPSLRKVTFDIAQPRVDEEEFDRISTAVVEGDTLESAPDFLDARVCAALDDPMTLDTGRKQCRFCIGCSCPAMRAHLQSMKMTMTPEVLAGIRRTPDDALLGDFVINARTVAKAIEDAQDMLKERIEKAGFVDAGCGTRITVKTSGGSYEFPNPAAFYAALTDLVPEATQRAECLKFSVTRTKDVISDVFDCPKTGKAPVTAEGIFDGKLRPLVNQKEKKTLIFS
jgi:PD-(D/E)XK nuclease superfamily protein